MKVSDAKLVPNDADRALLKTLLEAHGKLAEHIDAGLAYTEEVEMIAAHRQWGYDAGYYDSRQVGIREGIEMAAKVAEEWFPAQTASTHPKGGVVASIRALAGEVK